MKRDQQRLDQYELQHCLRRDTTNEVWKAFDSQQHRYVSLTRLRFTLPTGEAIHRFLRETRGIVALHHPHLVPIFEVRILSRTTSALSSNCEAYVVMDYIEGLSLAAVSPDPLHAQKNLPQSRLCRSWLLSGMPLTIFTSKALFTV